MKTTFSLDDWLSWFEAHHPMHQIVMGLDRVGMIATRLALLPWSIPTITVAGTNGKGSTVACLEAMLLAAGYRTGAYTSPHLLRYNERIRILGEDVTDDALCQAFAAVYAASDTSLTYFEYDTLAALWLFHQMSLDVVILEVGMGGRLDAVNLVDADVAIITTVDLDHQAWLGHDRCAIGREKAGIFRANRPAIYGESDPPQSVLDRAAALNVDLQVLGRDFTYQQTDHAWEVHGRTHFTDLPLPAVALSNAASAIVALQQLPTLPCSHSHMKQAIGKVALPGRLQQWSKQPRITLDVAHNPQAARRLAAELIAHPVVGQSYALVGMLQDKDIGATLSPLSHIIDHWVVASLPGERGADATIVADRLHLLGCHVLAHYSTVLEAYTQVLSMLQPEDQLVVFGSFHTVGPVLAAKR